MIINSFIKKYVEKIAARLQPIQIKIEVFILLVLLLGLAFIRNDIEIYSVLINISLSTLSIIYFIMAFLKESEIKNKISLFLNKLINLSFSISMIAILFTIKRYPGAATMLYIGIASMIFGLIGILIQRFRSENLEIKDKQNALRAIIIMLFLAAFYLTGDIDDLRKYDYQKAKKELINEK